MNRKLFIKTSPVAEQCSGNVLCLPMNPYKKATVRFAKYAGRLNSSIGDKKHGT